MFYLDKIILNYLQEACAHMGKVFGLDADMGALMWLILIGGLIAIYLRGGKRGRIK